LSVFFLQFSISPNFATVAETHQRNNKIVWSSVLGYRPSFSTCMQWMQKYFLLWFT